MTTSTGQQLDSTISVVLVSPLPPPLGGHTVWTSEFLAAAPLEGIHVTLVDTSPGGDQVNARSRVRARRVLQMAGTLWRVRATSARGSIVHVTTTWFWSLVRDGACTRVARRRGAAVVLHIHASTNVTSSLTATSPAARWLLRRWLRCVDTVVVLSAELVDPLHSLLPKAKVAVVPNWVDTEKFRPRNLESRTSAASAAAGGGGGAQAHAPSRIGPCRVLFVGRLMAEKGFLELAEAVCRNEGLYLVSIGDRPSGVSDAQRTKVDSALATLAETGRHEHHQAVSRAEIADHYRSADVFTLPSWNEGLPISLLEAMASGLPCVITAVGGMADLLAQHDGTDFAIEVPIADTDGLAAALSSLARDPMQCRKLGAAGRRIVTAEHSQVAAFERLRAVYTSVQAQRSSRR